MTVAQKIRLSFITISLALTLTACAPKGPSVELIRDQWGVPHIFAENEADGFFGVGYASAEDRLLQMEIWRRRAAGRLAEIFGDEYIESDRKFRIAGITQLANESFQAAPDEMKSYLRAYAAGVNAWVEQHPEAVKRRFEPLGVLPEPWTAADPLLSLLAVSDLFDRLFDDSAVENYRAFQSDVAKVGEAKAAAGPGLAIDEEFVVVPESEMAKDTELYARLQAAERSPGYLRQSAAPEPMKFSHAWVLGPNRTTTGKPIVHSEPRLPVTNPGMVYEYHLSAGSIDSRGINMPGTPGLLLGFNQNLAWGVTALGAGSTVTFLEKLSDDGKGYLFQGDTVAFDQRLEQINVKGGKTVVQEVLTNQHGFVFNSLTSMARPGEAFVSHYKQAQDKGSSVFSMIGRMAATDWDSFIDSLDSFYVPGTHMLYGDTHGNIGYQTLSHIPKTKRSRRIALEGWTGQDEVLGRIPLRDMPRMFNPELGFIGNGNNRPVGAWYPYDLGVNSTGSGGRGWRVLQLLSGDHKFSLDELETRVHRDSVHPTIAALLPVARKVAAEDKFSGKGALHVLEVTQGWDFRFQTGHPAYHAATALSEALEDPFKTSGLQSIYGRTEAGASHLGRILQKRFEQDGATPKDRRVRKYLLDWLTAAAEWMEKNPEKDYSILELAYQANPRMGLPPVSPALDIKSAPLTTVQTGTMWSQEGNSYTQIVDLSDIDNSRAMIALGVTEDPQSPFYMKQMDLWAKGELRPAPLSRKKVDEIAASTEVIAVRPFKGKDALPLQVVPEPPPDARFLPAIPRATISGQPGARQ